MKALRNEIETRFPEVHNTMDEDDGAYTLMHRVVEWLQRQQGGKMSVEIVERVRRFKEWCEEQPRTNSAEDDIWTIFIVGFWEDLFKTDSTRILIPKLMSREEVVANRTYLEAWVGAENFQMAMHEYDRKV